MANMLEFWRSLFKQSNPSTLTAADLIPNFTQPQPPPLTRDGDGINGESEGETRFSLLSPNCASRAKGFDVLHGGDPRKNGGDEATPDNRPSDRPARLLRSDRAQAKARSLRSDQALVPLGRYVATGLEPKFGRYAAIELFRTSMRHQSMHSRQTFKCYLWKTVAGSVHVFRYSNSSIKLCGLETAENSFIVRRNRSKRVESEDGPKGPKTRLEAHPTISYPKARKPQHGLRLVHKEG
ncbi:hypothetical protein F2Q70_00003044 [Brassica cretica]|uniref:Uncharacterized protein n=1 Tax=Brassica cretica TaxID=69181 RepID=A0A8S9IRN6_BRACR|nr:hypothetical protein F2Q70_00003044 [Brassica cretica]